MQKPDVISGLFCAALVFGCSDDTGTQMTTATGTTGTTSSSSDATASDSTTSAGTGSPTTGTSGTSIDTAPTTGTTGPVTGTTTTTGGGCGGFICPPDGVGDSWGECDPWVQSCPEGEKCMPYSGDGDNSWESLKCTAVDPNPGQVGDPCTTEGGGVSGIDTCDVGLMCWNLDMDGNGTCIAMCTGSPDAPMCDPGTSCTIANDGVLILCLPPCDPLVQDCSDTEVCIPNMDNFICVLDASGEEGQEYDACEYANACDPGFFCAGPENDDSMKCDPMAIGCCLAFCDLTAPAPQCTSTQDNPNSLVECVSWYEMDMAPPGYENVGVCMVPA